MSLLTKLIIDHGAISFNNEYMLNHGQLSNSTQEIDKLLFLDSPFRILKKTRR